jgi:hypothetical protein
MTFLRRVLKVQAALWALTGLVVLAVPNTVLDAFGVPVTSGGVALLRVLGVAAIVLALLMVLVGQHASEAWWWTWAFAVLEAGVATVFVLQALLGDDGHAWPWLALGVGSIVFGILDLVGLVRGEQEKPVV